MHSRLPAALRVRAASYVRMSTDHQVYSTQNQMDYIEKYAAARGVVIVRNYDDPGKSGLTIKERPGLRRLISDIQSGSADFDAILVYDVSRWGRFQDVDESAFYEFLCKRAGVAVIYCSEPFENDGTPVAAIMKSVKRVMAAEYSRDMSKRSFTGIARTATIGYHTGSQAPYGLRRVLLDASGVPKGDLAFGDRKAVHSDRVILGLGPPDEIRNVKLVFELFTEEGLGEQYITNRLNERGIRGPSGPWKRDQVASILRNEKYTGALVWNKTSMKLGNKPVRNPREVWVRTENAFPAIVDPLVFEKAQTIIRDRVREIPDGVLLASLARLYAKHGYLSESLMRSSGHKPTSHTYRKRFGSLQNAYALVGFHPERLDRAFSLRYRCLDTRATAMARMLADLYQAGVEVWRTRKTRIFLINREFTVSVAVMPFVERRRAQDRWTIRRSDLTEADINILARLNRENERVQDYYFVPQDEIPDFPQQLYRHNGHRIDSYRSPDFTPLLKMTERAAAEVST